MALGARPGTVVRLVVGRVAILLLAGVRGRVCTGRHGVGSATAADAVRRGVAGRDQLHRRGAGDGSGSDGGVLVPGAAGAGDRTGGGAAQRVNRQGLPYCACRRVSRLRTRSSRAASLTLLSAWYRANSISYRLVPLYNILRHENPLFHAVYRAICTRVTWKTLDTDLVGKK